jgi:hypothetical protein
LGVQIENTLRGWTSDSRWSELAEDDFKLVKRVIGERSPDGLAMLLRPSSGIGNIDLTGHEQEVVLGITASKWVSQLTACELGLALCDTSNYVFRNACADFGGCHQPDLASLIRYVLGRDGAPPILSIAASHACSTPFVATISKRLAFVERKTSSPSLHFCDAELLFALRRNITNRSEQQATRVAFVAVFTRALRVAIRNWRINFHVSSQRPRESGFAAR